MRRVLATLMLLLVAGSPAAAGPLDGPHDRLALDGLRGPWLGAGPILGFGLDVSPLRPVAAALESPEAARIRLADPGRAVSFDLTLRWPSVGDDTPALRPYVAFGPALFVSEPLSPLAVLGERQEPALSLGLRAGAGLTWQVDRNATLFGESQITRGGADALLPSGSPAGGVTGFDVLYGVRIRF